MAERATEIYNMTKEEWTKGVGANIVDSFTNMIPDNWDIMSKEGKVQALNAIRGQSILGDIFFTYLNEVNKGAPSDADMKLMEKIVTAGKSDNLSATKTALSEFMNNAIEVTSRNYANAMGKVPANAYQEFQEAEETKKYKWDNGFFIGREYTDSNGNKAVYKGKNKWEEVK